MQAKGNKVVGSLISKSLGSNADKDKELSLSGLDEFQLFESTQDSWLVSSFLSQTNYWGDAVFTTPHFARFAASLSNANGLAAPEAVIDFAVPTGEYAEFATDVNFVKGLTSRFDGNESFARGAVSGGGGSSGGGGGKTGKVLTDYYSGSADGTAGYDIWIKFSGSGWTTSLQKAFIDAADYLTTVITADIGGGGRIDSKTVDDLYVSAELKSIDGVGGILGQAGVTHVWTSNELAAAGIMQFDSADVSSYLSAGLWDDIVTHELMHVLGFGSLWNYGQNPLALTPGQYTGSAALAAYNEATKQTNSFIPVETGGGAGTAGAHWSEAVFGSELMTGYIDQSNYLSKFSVMSLDDLGYSVAHKDYPHDGVFIA